MLATMHITVQPIVTSYTLCVSLISSGGGNTGIGAVTFPAISKILCCRWTDNWGWSRAAQLDMTRTLGVAGGVIESVTSLGSRLYLDGRIFSPLLSDVMKLRDIGSQAVSAMFVVVWE